MSITQNPAPAAPDDGINAKILYENERMRLLGRRDGFIRAYFEELEHVKTSVAAFETINAEYERYFGEERYSCWKSFERAKNNLIKKQQ